MTLTVETGAGIIGADSYVAVADVDTYWTNRPQLSYATTWAALDTADKEGVAREASQYADALYGPYYRGVRKSGVQGLLFPRSDAYDEAGYPINGIPMNLANAICELCGRGAGSALASDSESGGVIESYTEKIGPITDTVKYSTAPSGQTEYGIVAGIIAPLLRKTAGGATLSTWAWR